MFYTNLSNVAQKRTCTSLLYYAAEPQAFTLDTNYNAAISGDIYPGMVMMQNGNGVVTVCDGLATSVPVGFSAHFVAPSIGIDEVTNNGGRDIGIWVGGQDAQFDLLVSGSAAPFDTTKTWAMPTDGSEVLLVTGSGTANKGLLCPRVTNTVTGAHAVLSGAQVVAKLVGVPSASEIIVAPVSVRV